MRKSGQVIPSLETEHSALKLGIQKTGKQRATVKAECLNAGKENVGKQQNGRTPESRMAERYTHCAPLLSYHSITNVLYMYTTSTS